MTRSLRRSVSRRGFSLLELLAVVTLLGILAAVILPRIGGSTAVARKKMSDQYRSDLNAAAERFFLEQGRFPKSLEELREADYYPAEIPRSPVDGSEYVLDEQTGRVHGSP